MVTFAVLSVTSSTLMVNVGSGGGGAPSPSSFEQLQRIVTQANSIRDRVLSVFILVLFIIKGNKRLS